jgi:hypothetical protein
VHDGGIAALPLAWQTYGVLITAVYGLLLSQDAYKSASLPASLPPLTVVEPVAGIAVGVGVLDETINLGGAALVGEIAAIVLMVVGSYVLAHSPLVAVEQREDPVPTDAR